MTTPRHDPDHSPRRPSWFRRLLLGLSLSSVALAAVAGPHVWSIAEEARERFASKKWELPARVFARALELYPGVDLSAENLLTELRAMSYRETERIDGPGSYARRGDTFTLWTRPFRFEDGTEPSRTFRLVIEDGRVSRLSDLETDAPLALARLDPAHIGGFYPTHQQDRLWVPLANVSPELIQTILAVEDRDFHDHHGIKPSAILRALLTNLRKGRAVQGGSTLTQQLVKNLFLTNEQRLKRKLVEAVMALSLEIHFSKEQILEAYINEVFLGQDGSRAIHGFGMASEFYFGRLLESLRPHETALLVGMLKGPSQFDPRRHPERATERRNLVLDVMLERNLIRPEEADAAKKAPLDLRPDPPSGVTRYPAFMELVQRRLLKEYNETDLRTAGLRIFTSFDPLVQNTVESAIIQRVAALETSRGLPAGTLETAAVVTDTGGNEILAITGGRDPRMPGFNRALDARRSIGSLIKPVVYLTALSRPDRYTLASMLPDIPFQLTDPHTGAVWSPQNYDHQYHGDVPLYRALAHSYNVPTVRLGMDLGVDKVLLTLRQMGVDRDIPPYPSVLLGAVDLSALEVAQMYQTLASGGFFTPIRAIRGVFRPDGSGLQRYPLTITQRLNPSAVYLLNQALQAVAVEGTARALGELLPPRLAVAGKTGTTDDNRDSWFAGFSGNRLAVVWMGRDDNQPTGFSGASGAMRVWAAIMAGIPLAPLRMVQPADIEWVTVDLHAGMRTSPSCPEAMSMPFIAGSAPAGESRCTGSPASAESPNSFFRWLKDLF